MPDEITIKTKLESDASIDSATTNTQTVNLTRTHVVNLFAVGLGLSFFLPWAKFFGANLSGYDLQQAGDEQRLLWAIPLLCAITIIAGLAKRSQKVIGQLTGILPFIVGVYWYCKLGNDLFHVLRYGAFISLICGAVIFILPRKAK